MMESACMMLDHLDQRDISARIRNAIASVISDGKVRTYDMLKLPGKQEVIKMGAASTVEMTDAIIQNMD